MKRNRGQQSFRTDTRAASETLGYILLVSVVFFSIFAILSGAVPLIQDQQDQEYVSNTMKAFDILDNNIDAMENDQAPARETEIRYRGGELFLEQQTVMTVNVEDLETGVVEEETVFLRPITYRFEDTRINYEMGAVIRETEDSAHMRNEPNFEFSKERTKLSPVATTIPEEPRSLGPSGRVAIQKEKTGTQTEILRQQDEPSDIDLTITIESERYELWGDYLESHDNVAVTSIDHEQNSVTVTVNTAEVFFRTTEIQITSRL